MPSNTLAERLGELGPVYPQFCEELDPAATVANSFRTQVLTNPHLSIIVRPASSKWQDMSSHYPSTDLVPAPSPKSPLNFFALEEIHTKIWNQEDLKLKLFRHVKVTPAHYAELQKRLNNKHPDRDSPKYDGVQHDVQSIKLEILGLDFQAKSGHRDNSEGDGDDPETSNEDGSEMDVDDPRAEANDEHRSEINSDSPFTLRYLDLSPLALSMTPFRRFPSVLFIRREYDLISALIEKRPRNGQGSVVVSGQPGTGELFVSLSYGI